MDEDQIISDRIKYLLSDAAYTDIYNSSVIVKSLIEDFVPASITENMDFSSLELWPDQYYAGSLKDRCGNVVWRVGLKNGAWCCVVLLLEYGPRDEQGMARRMTQYIVHTLNSLIDQGEMDETDGLPVVLPLVLYTGMEEWQEPPDLSEHFASMPEKLRKYCPHQRCILVDAGHVKSDVRGVALNESTGLAAQLCRLEQVQDPGELRMVLHRLVELTRAACATEDAGELKTMERLISRWLGHILALMAPEGTSFQSAKPKRKKKKKKRRKGHA